MYNTKRSLFLGLGGMIILQLPFWYCYTTSMTNNLSQEIDMFLYVIIPIVITTIYSLFEKHIIFSNSSTSEERLHLGILWIAFSLICTVSTSSIIYFDDYNYPYVGFKTIFSDMAGGIFIGFFIFYRTIFHKNSSITHTSTELNGLWSVCETIFMGIVGMTTIQYIYWANLTTTFACNILSLNTSHSTDSFSDVLSLFGVFILSVLYCLYERYTIFPSDDSSIVRTVLAVCWVVETLIGNSIFMTTTENAKGTFSQTGLLDTLSSSALPFGLVSFMILLSVFALFRIISKNKS